MRPILIGRRRGRRLDVGELANAVVRFLRAPIIERPKTRREPIGIPGAMTRTATGSSPIRHIAASPSTSSTKCVSTRATASRLQSY
jgi:hypothetical protein